MSVDTERRQKKLAQVRALLDQAASTTFPAEAAACRQKADDLMLSYTLSEYEVNERRPKHERETPTHRYINICGSKHPLKTQLIDLFGEVSRHCRCHSLYTGLHNQQAASQGHVYGFPSDIEYMEMLFTSLEVQMARNLEPQPNPEFSYEANIAMLKEAGLKWARIWEIMHPGQGEITHATGVKYTGMYKKYCEDNDRPRMKTSPQQYQRNYAEGFVIEVADRLRQIREHQYTANTGNGMAVALRDRKSEVDAFFLELNPKRGKGITLAGRSKFDGSAFSSGRADGRKADLGQTRVAPRREIGS